MADRDEFKEITFSTCPECSSEAHYDSRYDFYSCHCGETWSYGANDPDFDDDYYLSGEEVADAGLMRHIERYSMYGWLPNDQN